MNGDKYYVAIGYQTIAENMTLEYALMLTKAVFETYYADTSMVVAIAKMDEVSE